MLFFVEKYLLFFHFSHVFILTLKFCHQKKSNIQLSFREEWQKDRGIALNWD